MPTITLLCLLTFHHSASAATACCVTAGSLWSRWSRSRWRQIGSARFCTVTEAIKHNAAIVTHRNRQQNNSATQKWFEYRQAGQYTTEDQFSRCIRPLLLVSGVPWGKLHSGQTHHLPVTPTQQACLGRQAGKQQKRQNEMASYLVNSVDFLAGTVNWALIV